MLHFKTRLSRISKTNGKVILANDYDSSVEDLQKKTLRNIKQLHPYLCGIKLNFHLLLPLGKQEILKINQAAHKYGLQSIADIKLNDIGNTNKVTAEHLWNLGFDAVIVNPIMGFDSLKKLVRSAHTNGKGVITLCHMSAPEAKLSYDMRVTANQQQEEDVGKQQQRQQQRQQQQQHLYQLFLDWALNAKADGIIVGATFPDIIEYCSQKSQRRLSIFSPGVGTQGGSASDTISAGTNYLIVGRTILNSENPVNVAKQLQLVTGSTSIRK